MGMSMSLQMRMEMVFILGASDPEMEAIEKVLVEGLHDRDVKVYHAAVKDVAGKLRRVKPTATEAYNATHLLDVNGNEVSIDDIIVDDVIYAHVVECRLAVELRPCACMPDHGGCSNCKEGFVGYKRRGSRFDHHNPGDPGYDKAPKDYWKGSSIGQVHEFLFGNSMAGKVVKACDNLLMVAAADHCLAAALNGDCLGVDKDALLQWRMESRAAFQKRTVKDVAVDIAKAKEYLKHCGYMEIKGLKVAIVKDHIPELPDAASSIGMAYITEVVDKDGKRKVSMGGYATPDAITAFMDVFPLEGFYGGPLRGFAGGYLPDGVNFMDMKLRVRVGGFKNQSFSIKDIDSSFLFGQGCFCFGPIPVHQMEDYYDAEGGDIAHID